MNRRKFVVTWGRKIFFGMSWPLTSLMGLIYLKSYIIPQTVPDVAYFLTTYIGHYGLLNALVYFLLYVPVVLLMPTYYVSRLWSLFLILNLNVLVLADGILFSSYLYHGYSFILKLLINGGLEFLPDLKALTILVPCGVIFISVVLWIRGEFTWRSMQRRFSNPVSNWYLGLIALCLILSQAIFYNGNVSRKVASLFPLNFTIGESNVVDKPKYYYPLSSITCKKKENKNFIFFVVDQWSSAEFNDVDMPHLWAMKKHAQVYSSHYAASFNPNLGNFILEYSLPGNYEGLSLQKESVLTKELKKRGYEISRFDNIEGFNEWVSTRHSDEIQPFYTIVRLKSLAIEVDLMLQNAVNLLQTEGFLSGTHLVMTGAYGGSETATVPFMMMTNERKPAHYDHMTSHYDVVPTLLDQEFGCSKTYEYASVGKPLSHKKADWFFISRVGEFRILDFKTQTNINVKDSNISYESMDFSNNPIRKDVIFEGIKLKTKFSRPK